MREFGVVDHIKIKSFDKMNCLGQCAEWKTEVIRGLG